MSHPTNFSKVTETEKYVRFVTENSNPQGGTWYSVYYINTSDKGIIYHANITLVISSHVKI